MLINGAEFTARDARERLTGLMLRSAVRIALKPALSPSVPIPWQRWWLRKLQRLAHARRSRDRIDILDSIVGGVTGEWVLPLDPNVKADSRAAILYLHGGAYCVGTPALFRGITCHLARATGLPVFVPDYRLAPEHPFPAAVDDAVSVYRSLAEIWPVVIAGDSSGGGLSLATAFAAREQQIKLPAALILFSPWVDMTTSAAPDTAAKREPVLSYPWLNDCARHYLAGGDPAAPLASPIYGELRGLPPILIQTGSDEILHGDAVRIHDALLSAGVSVRCEIMPAHWHLIQLHAATLPTAHAAIERVGDFILSNIAP